MTFIALAPNFLAYFVGVVQFRSPLRLRLVCVTLVMITIYVIATAFSQIPIARATGEQTPYVLASGEWTNLEVRIRGLGMLNDPNDLGQYLLMILPMLFVSKRKAGLGFLGYTLAIPIAVLLVTGVYFTNSRGAAMGLAVLIGLFLTKRFGTVVSVPVGLLLMLANNAITSSRTISMAGGEDRLAIWSDGMQFFKHSPLWGVGFLGFEEREFMTAHNSFLLCAAEMGLLGFFLWMGMVVVTMIQLNRVPKVVGETNPALARWAIALKSSLSVYMFTSFFLSRTYELPLFLLLGMSGAIIAAAGGDDAMPLHGTKWPVWSLGLCVGILILIYVMLRLRV
jgi:hypothetical protein